MGNDDDRKRQIELAKKSVESLIKVLSGIEVQAIECTDQTGLKLLFPDQDELTGKANSLDRVLRLNNVQVGGVRITTATQVDDMKVSEEALQKLILNSDTTWARKENYEILEKYLRLRKCNLGIKYIDYSRVDGQYIPDKVVVYVNSSRAKKNLPEVVGKCSEVVVVGRKSLKGLAELDKFCESLKKGEADLAQSEARVAELLLSVIEYKDCPTVSLAIGRLKDTASKTVRVSKEEMHDGAIHRSREIEYYRYDGTHLEPLYRVFGRVMAVVFLSKRPTYTDQQRRQVMNFLCEYKTMGTRMEALFIEHLQQGISNHFKDSQSPESKIRFRCEALARKWYRDYLEEEERRIDEANTPGYGW